MVTLPNQTIIKPDVKINNPNQYTNPNNLSYYNGLSWTQQKEFDELFKQNVDRWLNRWEAFQTSKFSFGTTPKIDITTQWAQEPW